MRKFQIKIAYLSLLFACMTSFLMAQDINPDGWKWGNDPSDFLSKEEILRIEHLVHTRIANHDKTKAIYKALAEENIADIASYLAAKMIWNDKKDFVFAGIDPQIGNDMLFNIFFNSTSAPCTNWRLYDITYEEQFDNLITVSGNYKANYQGVTKEGTFLHVWTWEDGHAISFQHYETSRAKADLSANK